jgi:hypothetical protein
MEEGQKKQPRMRFSPEASERLLKIYNSGILKPNRSLREELALELDKTPRSIQIWFQNKRAKQKNSTATKSEEELDSDEKKTKTGLSKLNLASVERFSSPKSAQMYKSPLKSPQQNGPKSAFLFPPPQAESFTLSPKAPGNRLSQSPPQVQKVLDRSRFSPYPSPLDQASPRPASLQPSTLFEPNSPPTTNQLTHQFSPPRFQINTNLTSLSEGMAHSAIELGQFETAFSDMLPSGFIKKMQPLSIHSAVPYYSPHASVFTFPDIPPAASYEPHLMATTTLAASTDSLSNASSSPKSKLNSISSIPDLGEISSDPAKFMEWVSTSSL